MTHKMELITDHEGTEEWNCPICGRNFLVEWRPEYRMEVIVVGDVYAGHSGSRGGLDIGSVQVSSDEE